MNNFSWARPLRDNNFNLVSGTPSNVSDKTLYPFGNNDKKNEVIYETNDKNIDGYDVYTATQEVNSYSITGNNLTYNASESSGTYEITDTTTVYNLSNATITDPSFNPKTVANVLYVESSANGKSVSYYIPENKSTGQKEEVVITAKTVKNPASTSNYMQLQFEYDFETHPIITSSGSANIIKHTTLYTLSNGAILKVANDGTVTINYTDNKNPSRGTFESSGYKTSTNRVLK